MGYLNKMIDSDYNSCNNCHTFSHVYNNKCGKCEARHAARMIKTLRRVWWHQKKSSGADLSEIEAYWWKVKEYDENR